jgi:hypothetical protein
MPKGAKYGGRKKGTPNKSTVSAEEFRAALLNKAWPLIPQIFDDIQSLKPEERAKLMLRLIQIIMPAQTSMNLNLTNLDEMKQIIASKYPFGGISPPDKKDDKTDVEQKPQSPD